MNLVERILATHSDTKEIHPGQIVNARVDLVFGSELSTILAIEEFEKVGAKGVFDPDKIVIVPDHFTPAKDIQTAEICKRVREWVRAHGIRHYFEIGRGGIGHVLLPERGLILPGTLVIGGDSHTVTYGALGCLGIGVGSTDMAAAFITGQIWLKVPQTIKVVFHGRLRPWVGAKDMVLLALNRLGADGARYMAVEYAGEAVRQLHISGRFTLCNMSAEMGAKAGIIEPDEKTQEYLDSVTTLRYEILKNPPEASYAKVYEFEVDQLEPMVACPPSPTASCPVGSLQGLKLDQVLIGSCTNGRIEDLRVASAILDGRKVHPDVRLIVVPGSQEVYLKALREGIISRFIEAGAAVSTPTCGACIGGHMGVLASGEVCLSTTNRNFIGRMGHTGSKVYLCNPAVAAASAVAGCIVHPAELGSKVPVPV
jgi:3-isopropylmalate/(R)-2-methylmalate dehydratase large subunit